LSIKSRKLFAILVMTAMILTMLPLTAFAADDYSYSASFVDVNKTSVRVDSAEDVNAVKNYVTFTVVLLDSGRKYFTGNVTDLYIKSSRDAENVAYQYKDDDDGGKLKWKKIEGSIDKETGANLGAEDVYVNKYGEVKVRVWSGLAGKANISFHKDTSGSDGEKAGPKIGEETITFTSSAAKVKDVVVTVDESGDTLNVGDEITLRARVTDDDNIGVDGVTVTFQKCRDGGSWQTVGSKDTNRQGVATLKVVENEAGDYEYRGRVSGKTGDPSDVVTFGARTPVALEKVTEDGTKIAVDEDYKVKFKMKDYLGNVCTDVSIIDLEVIEAPSDSGLEDDIIEPESKVDDDKNVVFVFTPDEAGTYKLRAEVKDTGLRETLTLEAKEFGTVTEVKVSLPKDKTALRADDHDVRWGDDDDDAADTMQLKVKLLDEDGVEISTTDDSAVRLASSNVSLVAISESDFGVVAGPIKADRTGVAVVTATHLDTGISGSVEVPVVGAPAAIDVDVDYNGLKADVSMQVVDSQGNPSYFESDEDTDYNVVAKDVTISNPKKFKEGTGKATFTASVDEYDSYKVTVVTHNGYSTTFDLDFEEAAEEVDVANVTMFIGSTNYVADGSAGSMDVAPFIEDGRTFVPVRFIAEAFGAEVDWEPKDAATEKVFVTSGDIEITITIGEYTIEVVSDDETETVVSDVAAFIRDGRTFLPLRAIGEILGAEFDWGPKDADTEWVSFSL
jgi:hypothetical protein